MCVFKELGSNRHFAERIRTALGFNSFQPTSPLCNSRQRRFRFRFQLRENSGPWPRRTPENPTRNARARRLASEKSASSHRAPCMERDVLVTEDAAAAASAPSSSFAETRVICRVCVLTVLRPLPTLYSPQGLWNLCD